VPSHERLRAAAVQWDIRRGDIAANLSAVEELVTTAADDEVTLAVLPEMWATSFMGDEVDFVGRAAIAAEVASAEQRLQTLSGDLAMVVVGSNYEFADDGKVYNLLHVYDNGRHIASYRKIHLFTPLGEDRYFANGTEALVTDTSAGRLGFAVCYDLRFPELIRYLYLTGALILVVPSQWPQPRANHWRLLTRARAVENQWFVIGANRCGVEPSLINEQEIHFPGNSILVNPSGEVLAEGNGEPGIVAADFDLKEAAIVRRAIPVAKDRCNEAYENLWGQDLRLPVSSKTP